MQSGECGRLYSPDCVFDERSHYLIALCLDVVLLFKAYHSDTASFVIFDIGEEQLFSFKGVSEAGFVETSDGINAAIVRC